MSTTTLHFGPEWMRTKQVTRPHPPPSPPTASLSASAISTYSALVSPTPPIQLDKVDEIHPFRYSKDELLKIYQESGGKGNLGLEVERWDGVVREVGGEPITLHEMSETEKKLFAGPLNSEQRRRPSQSTDHLSPLNTTLDRSRMPLGQSPGANSPLRERFGALKRRDSTANMPDGNVSIIPRKPSLSSLPLQTMSREGPSRPRVGYTPNFDGVLHGGDSWMARRRASEASLKPDPNVEPNIESLSTIKQGNIREEKEEDVGGGVVGNENLGSHLATEQSYTFTEEPGQMPPPANDMTSTNAVYSTVTSAIPNNRSRDHNDVGPPPGLMDFSTIEWSYKDPTGQIQGPFAADLMQRWFNEGYFSSDLPMKRTHLDDHWSTLEDLIQRATGNNVFLSPLAPIPNRLTPLGKSLPPQTSHLAEQTHMEPYQPAPIRSLRTVTLESYLSSGSLPSDSPSSSFSPSLGNPSPDPSIFAERDHKGYTHNDSSVNGRLNNLPNAAYGGFVPEQSNYQFNSNMYPAQDPWTAPVSIANPRYGIPRDVHNDRMYLAPGAVFDGLHHADSPQGISASVNQSQPFGHFNHGYAGGEMMNHNNLAMDPRHQSQRQYSSGHLQGLQASDPYRFRAIEAEPHPSLVLGTTAANVPTWQNHPESVVQHTNLQEVPQHPQSLPPHPIQISQSPWSSIDNSMIPNQLLPEHTSASVAVPITNMTWNDADANTTGNAALQEQPELIESLDMSNLSVGPSQPKASPPPEPAIVPSASPVPPSPIRPAKTSAKITIDPPAPREETVAVSATPKSAWAVEEERKGKKGPVVSVSLREIQEAEAKKAELRKAAERERERSARLAVNAELKEDVQPFSASWGLPTSQAGSRGATVAVVKDTSSTPNPSSGPVWTTPLKQPTVKKSMKEILEEEEKRKKQQLAKDASPQVLPKRAYAETTNKTSAATSSSSNNAWTTVGPSGKSTAPPAPPPTRPPVQTLSTPSPSSNPKPLVLSSQRPLASSSTKPRPPPRDDTLYSPSHEFLKWLSDSLKGLNNSVNVEEIVSMLLSFPLDPDPTTVEIISDTIYSNSTTLDGRRFASEFIAKRKADASSRTQGSSSTGKSSAKPVSIADVVKAAPKTTQPEWGFKVVNKKKKGGRP